MNEVITNQVNSDRNNPETRVCDPESLIERCMGEVSAAVLLLSLFRDRLPGMIEEIRDGLADQNDLPGVLKKLHTLKGNAGNLSLDRLYLAAVRLEQTLREDRVVDVSRHLSDLRCEAELLLSAIPLLMESLESVVEVG